MATAPDAQKAIPSQENLLLDYVRRLEKHRGGRQVVHVHLSQLRPFNRREQHIRAATSSFDPLISTTMGQPGRRSKPWSRRCASCFPTIP